MKLTTFYSSYRIDMLGVEAVGLGDDVRFKLDWEFQSAVLVLE